MKGGCCSTPLIYMYIPSGNSAQTCLEYCSSHWALLVLVSASQLYMCTCSSTLYCTPHLQYWGCWLRRHMWFKPILVLGRRRCDGLVFLKQWSNKARLTRHTSRTQCLSSLSGWLHTVPYLEFFESCLITGEDNFVCSVFSCLDS